MKNAKQPQKKRKGMGWKGKTLIGLGITFGAVGGGLYYLGEKTLEMEAQIDQTNFDEVCVTVGEPAGLADNPLMNVFNNDLAKIFNALQNSPLGKQLYDYADAADLKTCYLDDIAQEIHATAFVDLQDPPYMGYGLSMITSSTHSGAETTGHEFFHFYQRNNAQAARFTPGNASTGDHLLRLMIMEAAAKTVGTMVLYEMDESPQESVSRYRLTADDRVNFDWYKRFLKKYEDQPAEDAKIMAAKDMMRHLLIGDILHDGWRASYLKRLYVNEITTDEETGHKVSDETAFRALYEELRQPQHIRFSNAALLKLSELPDGRNIMPDNLSQQDILDAMLNTVKEMVETYDLWPEKENRPDSTPKLTQTNDNDSAGRTKAASWRQRLSR
ncbi:MAG: hypothetical protein EP349_01740 [Alphaproteobacteria bacterium]|nr:MAG: hypothetical protein EP349_01740 [Alphaproteobacteria bacterium]